MSVSLTPYFDAAVDSLPRDISSEITAIREASEAPWTTRLLDDLIRFALGVALSKGSDDAKSEWTKGQAKFMSRLDELEDSHAIGKRRRTDGEDADMAATSSSKKQKLVQDPSDPDSTRLFTLNGISVASPVRKKLDITITSTSILLEVPFTRELAASIPLASFSRSFLVANMSKNKIDPRWTVMLLSSDTWDRKKEKHDKKADKTDPAAGGQVQVIFSLEEAPTTSNLFTTTTYPHSPVKHAKSTDTYPYIKTLLSHLPGHVTTIETLSLFKRPTDKNVFRSAEELPYVNAYRDAKEGNLYLLDEGILWGNNKPCEFFALEDIAPDEDETGGGLRMLSVTGRAFSLHVRRRGSGDNDEGEETEFSIIDGKEKDCVQEWMRTRRPLLGKPAAVTPVNGADANGKGKEKDPQGGQVGVGEAEESDASDEDFTDDEESDGGSPSSSSESDREGSESGVDGGEDEAQDSGDDSDDVEEEDGEMMNAARHPLMRPGAMPRMSHAAINAVVAMVKKDIGVGSDDDMESEGDELDE